MLTPWGSVTVGLIIEEGGSELVYEEAPVWIVPHLLDGVQLFGQLFYEVPPVGIPQSGRPQGHVGDNLQTHQHQHQHQQSAVSCQSHVNPRQRSVTT